MCGLVSEGVDPHHSALLYHLRLLARRGQGGRLATCDVQISTGTAGKVRARPHEEGRLTHARCVKALCRTLRVVV